MKLRMPPELREKIEESAKEAGRSMNADIVYRLEKSFDIANLADDEKERAIRIGLAVMELEEDIKAGKL